MKRLRHGSICRWSRDMDADVLIIGAGVFGLSIARQLKKAGREVRVVDAVGAGAGASATPLGVLAPHAPDRWNEKKQAQFEALTSLASVAEELGEETGIDIGYRRCGRLIPLTREHHPQMWRGRANDALTNWQGQAEMSIVEPDVAWLSPEAAPFGAVLCGLSARVDARAYCAALAASVGAVEGGYRLDRLEEGAAIFESGERLTARSIVLTTGADAFRLLPNAREDTPAGRGEKGQAAILRLADGVTVDDLPLIYRDRLYIVPRGDGLISVGATSEREYADAVTTDDQLETLIARAKEICPRLHGAAVTERWARLRPRAADKRLLLGPHPNVPNVTVATGGFKTGLAMAHHAADQIAHSLAA